MRSCIIVGVGAALFAWLLTAGVSADQAGGTPSAATQPAGSQAIRQGSAETPMQGQGQASAAKIIRASDLIAREVLDSQDQKLGTVRDLVIGADNGRVCYVVLSRSALDTLLGKDLLAVPFDLFQWRANPKNDQKEILVLNVRPDQLHGAPQFAGNEWSVFGNQQFLSQVHQFYQGFERTASRPGGMSNPPSATHGSTTR